MAGELQTSQIDYDTVAVRRGKALDYIVRFDRLAGIKFAYRHSQPKIWLPANRIPAAVRQAAEDIYAQRFSR